MKKLLTLAIILLVAGGAQAQHRSTSSSKYSKAKAAAAAKKKAQAKKKKKYASRDEGRKFNFSLGLSMAISNSKVDKVTDGNGSYTMTRNATAAGIYAYPKYHIISKDNYSISIGIPLTIAFSSSANSRSTEESSTTFLYDLPLMIDFNGGCMAPAKRYAEGRLGYFVGVGIGIENTQANYSFESSGYTGSYNQTPVAKSVGPNVHAGVVFRIGSEDHPRFLGLRHSYKMGLNEDKFNYFTPSIFLNM